MKVLCYFLLTIVVLASCRKGKKLDKPVKVQIVCHNSASVNPKDQFPLFNASDPFETVRYPQYAHSMSPQQMAADFKESLISRLKENNILLTDDSAEYRLVIRSLEMSESLDRTSYTNACSNMTDYVYHASLNFTADVSLFRSQNLLRSWNKQGNSFERVKSGTDDCNRPKIGILFRGPSSLIDQVTHELQPLIAKKMYEEN